MAYRIESKDILNFEIIHYAEDTRMIASSHRRMLIQDGKKKKIFYMPFTLMDIFGSLRIMRRLFRLDKCNIFPLDDDFLSFLVIRQRSVYVFDLISEQFNFKFKLKNCRNVMHNSICSTPSGKIIFGEYGSNEKLDSVPVYASDDNGHSWSELSLFKKGEIRHIHTVSYDKYTNSIWLATGDDNGQCKLVKCNHDLNYSEVYGDGTQTWRTCGIFFEENHIYWLMDSPNEKASTVRMDREDRTIEKLHYLDGPVWYVKELSGGIKIAGVSVEPGSSVKTNYAQLLVSTDYIKWHKILEFPKDKWSMKYFKFGVISFSDGRQGIDNFYISGEGLTGLDGKSMKLSLSLD